MLFAVNKTLRLPEDAADPLERIAQAELRCRDLVRYRETWDADVLTLRPVFRQGSGFKRPLAPVLRLTWSAREHTLFLRFRMQTLLRVVLIAFFALWALGAVCAFIGWRNGSAPSGEPLGFAFGLLVYGMLLLASLLLHRYQAKHLTEQIAGVLSLPAEQ